MWEPPRRRLRAAGYWGRSPIPSSRVGDRRLSCETELGDVSRGPYWVLRRCFPWEKLVGHGRRRGRSLALSWVFPRRSVPTSPIVVLPFLLIANTPRSPGACLTQVQKRVPSLSHAAAVVGLTVLGSDAAQRGPGVASAPCHDRAHRTLPKLPLDPPGREGHLRDEIAPRFDLR